VRRGRKAGDIVDVLQPVRDAVQWAAPAPHADEGAQRPLQRLRPRPRRLGQLDGRELARADQRRGFWSSTARYSVNCSYRSCIAPSRSGATVSPARRSAERKSAPVPASVSPPSFAAAGHGAGRQCRAMVVNLAGPSPPHAIAQRMILQMLQGPA
jgi:hypothetical protein